MKVTRGRTARLSVLAEDLRVEDNSKIECTGEGESLKVEGEISCEGTVEFIGNVSCLSFRGDDCRIRSRSLSCQSLSIRDGSMEIIGDLVARSVDVDKRLIVTGRTEAEDIEVGGILDLAAVKGKSIEVGGTFRSNSDVEVDDIDVGGTVEIEGKIKAKSVDVGGKLKLNGGDVTGRIDVGGILESRQPLNFGDIDVGGIVTLSGSSKGGDVDVGGKLRVRGDLEFRRLDIGGVADVEGKAVGEGIDLGGRLSIASDLKLTDTLDVGGAAEIGGDTEARSVNIGGSLRSKSLKVERAELSGHVSTQAGIFATGPIRVERKSRVEGWIRSLDSVIVESRGVVESVSAPRIIMGERSKALNLYADLLEIEERVEILGEALYTQSISIHTSGFESTSQKPRKVETFTGEKRWNWNHAQDKPEQA